MYCRQCGYNNDNYSRMCKRCGSNLREANDLYDKLDEDETDEPRQGALRYSKPREKLWKLMRKPFKKLSRVEKGKKRYFALACAVSVLLLCGVAIIGVSLYRAKSNEKASVYGNDTGNIAQKAVAVSDGKWIFFSRPYGDNTGFYRVSIATGEELKISYKQLTWLSCTDNWIYGLDGDGALIRISKDGLVSQTIVDEQVSYPNVVSDTVYYIDSSGYICCAREVTQDGESWFEQDIVCGTPAGSLLAYNDWLYYTTRAAEINPAGSMHVNYPAKSGSSVTAGTFGTYETAPSTSATSSATTKAQSADSQSTTTTASTTTTTATTTTTTATSAQNEQKDSTPALPKSSTVAAGDIRRIRFDGTEDMLIYEGVAFNISIRGEYVYFLAENRETVSATDIDPEAPKNLTIDVVSPQTWRLYLYSLEYSRFLEPDTALSALNVQSGTIYYISTRGDIERAALNGQNIEILPTGAIKAETVTVLGDWLYYTAENGRVTGRIRSDGTCQEILSEAPEPEPEQPEK